MCVMTYRLQTLSFTTTYFFVSSISGMFLSLNYHSTPDSNGVIHWLCLGPFYIQIKIKRTRVVSVGCTVSHMDVSRGLGAEFGKNNELLK